MEGKRLVAVAFGLASLAAASACRSGERFRGPMDSIYKDARSLVIVVPTGEDDASAQKKIHEAARFFRGHIEKVFPRCAVEVMTDREALERDLSSSSLWIVGTPRGNLWHAKHLTDLPAAIEPGRIVADRAYEGSDLRFITVWPHPQNPEKGIVVYTGQRARDIIAINKVHHGGTDYVVARGEEVLGSGNYVNKMDRWAFRWRFSLSQAIEDLDFLFATIDRVHPYPTAYLEEGGVGRIRDRARAAVREAGERHGHVPISVLALVAAEAAASFGDGHTACRPCGDLLDETDPSACMPPFRLEWRAGGVAIAGTIGGLERLKGARLLAIDGKPLREAIAPILSKVSGEREAFRVMGFLMLQDVYWWLVRPAEGGGMTIRYRRGGEEPEELKVTLIPLARYRRELPPGPGPDPRGLHTFHHGGRTCYWQYNSFDDGPAGTQAIDAVFRDLRDHKAEDLIIDLRFNGGGSSFAGNHILDYLLAKPYYMYSRAYKGRLSGRPPSSRDLAGTAAPGWRIPDVPKDRGYRFEGRVHALIGPGTFSAAASFAHVLADYGIATLVGEETGGLRRAFGNCAGSNLPHSGLYFPVSDSLFYAPVTRPDDDARGTVPDIAIDDRVLAPFLGASDPELALTLDLIEKRRSASTAPGSVSSPPGTLPR
jgi:hypothetical protein